MSPVLADFALMWRAALAIRDARTNRWLWGGALLLALSVFAFVFFKSGEVLGALMFGLGVAYTVLAFGWVMYFVPGAIKLNSPANAALVPRMRRRMRQLTVLVWVAITGISTLALALGTPAPAHIAFLGIGVWLIALGLARSGHRAGAWIQLAVPMLFVLRPAIPQAWLAQLANPLVLTVLTLLVLALGAYTLDTMFPHGGDRHFKLRQEQKLVTDEMTIEGQFTQLRIPRLGLWAYGADLRRACARRDDGALLMHVLGPSTHWTQRALSLAVIVGGAAVVMALLRLQANADTLAAIARGGWIGASTALIVQLFDYERRLMRMSLTLGEQGLVRLAPRIPGAAPAFNRLVALRLLWAGLVEWALVSASVLALVAITGGSGATVWMQACICCLTLPLLASTLRDHAHRSGTGGWWLLLGLFASLGACFLAAAAASRLLGTELMPVAALASLLLAGAAIAWRWRRLVGAPHAFPVGRLA